MNYKLNMAIRWFFYALLFVLVCLGLAERGDGQQVSWATIEADYNGAMLNVLDVPPTFNQFIYIHDLNDLYPQPPNVLQGAADHVLFLEIVDPRLPLQIYMHQLEHVQRCLDY